MYESSSKKYFNNQRPVEELIERDSERIKDVEKRTIDTVIDFVKNQYSELENLLKESKAIAESKAYEEKIEGLIDKVEESIYVLKQNQENINYDKLQWGGTGEYKEHKDKIDTVVDATEYSSALVKDALDIFKNIDENNYGETEFLNESFLILEGARDILDEKYKIPGEDSENVEYGLAEALRFRAEQSREVASKIREAGEKFDAAIRNTDPIEINEQMVDDIAAVIENNENYQKLQDLFDGVNAEDKDESSPTPGDPTLPDNSEVEQNHNEDGGFLVH